MKKTVARSGRSLAPALNSLLAAEPSSLLAGVRRLILALPLLLAGCATTPPTSGPLPDVPEEVRAKLRMVQISPEGAPPFIWFHDKRRGRTFRKRMAEGQLARQRLFQDVADNLQGGREVAGIVFLPVIAVAVVGEVTSPAAALLGGLAPGRSRVEARQAEQTLAAVVAGDAVRKQLQAQMLGTARVRTPPSPIFIMRPNPAGDSEGQPSNAGSQPTAQARLEYEFLNLGLRSARGHGRRLRLNATLYCRLVLGPDGEQTQSFTVPYWSQPDSARSLAEWVVNDGLALRAELERCTRNLGEQMVDCVVGPVLKTQERFDLTR